MFFLRFIWSLNLACGLTILPECSKHGYIDNVKGTYSCTFSEDWVGHCRSLSLQRRPRVVFSYDNVPRDRNDHENSWFCASPFQNDICRWAYNPYPKCETCRCVCTGDLKYTLTFTPTVQQYNGAEEFLCEPPCVADNVTIISANCKKIKVSADPCLGAENLCLNGGNCLPDVRTPSLYVCRCRRGFSGQHCEKDPCQHEENPCQNGGNCTFNITILSRYTCTCAKGHKGVNCEETDPCQFESNVCLNGGNCAFNISSPTRYTCTCQKGYNGDDCQYTQSAGVAGAVGAAVAGADGTGSIVGGVVGAVVLLTLCAVVIFLFKRSKSMQIHTSRGQSEIHTPDTHNTIEAGQPSVPSYSAEDPGGLGVSGNEN